MAAPLLRCPLRRHRRLRSLPRARQAGLRPVALLLAIQISSPAVPPPSRLLLGGSTAVARGRPARGPSIEGNPRAFNSQSPGYDARSGRSGGTGRRAGLKIRWGASSVWVRLPPSAHTECGVGILTGGGDCPGLNAVIRAVARRSQVRGDDVVGIAVRVARSRRRHVRAARPARDLGPPAARRDDHRHLAHEPVQGRGRRRPRARELRARRASTRSSRSAARTRSASRPSSMRSTSSPSSGYRRRSTTTCPRPTTRSASTPPSRSAPRRSTGCTRPRSRTTA